MGDGGDVDGVCGVRWEFGYCFGAVVGFAAYVAAGCGGLAPLIGVFLKNGRLGLIFAKRALIFLAFYRFLSNNLSFIYIGVV